MTALILVRHGVTAENLNYVLIGQTDPPLNEHGLCQAQALATALSDEPICHIYSSPLQRCVQTAAAIAQAQPRAAWELCPALRELHLGMVDGMSSFDAYQRYQSVMDQALDESLPDFEFPGGESRQAALHRFQAGLQAISSRHPQDTVCVVTHGGPLGLWLAALHGEPLGRFRRWQPHHGSITRAVYDGQTVSIQQLDYRAHLPAERAEPRRWRG
ncbi:MAG: histidine phosphatase family protein [Alicyclobacillus sp.]|nr:histidine phosphatase family protein [Alicyclobacillus sp.]